MAITILFIGDIIGKPGRQALSRELHRLVDRYNADIVIANGENAAGGFGLTAETAKELFSQVSRTAVAVRWCLATRA